LRQVGEADRAFDLLAPLVQVLQDRGLIQDSLHFLVEAGEPTALHPSRQAWVHTFLGDAFSAYGDLRRALDAYHASLAIAERLAAADPSNATWQRDVFVSHAKLGRIEQLRQNAIEADLHLERAETIIGSSSGAIRPTSDGSRISLGSNSSGDSD